MKLEIEFADDPRLAKLSMALVELEGLDWGVGATGIGHAPATVLGVQLVADVLMEARTKGPEGWSTRIKAVRDLLRNGNYKPAGRAKPSSEYLLAAALEGNFPGVNPFVDAVNLASLKYMYPMSVFDADRAGSKLLCRLGAPGERYVFNSAGQEIDVEDLVCLCARSPGNDTPGVRAGAAEGSTVEAVGVPIANPVRDSMATKLFESAKNAVVAIYAPRGLEGADLAAAAADVALWCGRGCVRAETLFTSLP
jgi:Uncharacterized conserved protein